MQPEKEVLLVLITQSVQAPQLSACHLPTTVNPIHIRLILKNLPDQKDGKYGSVITLLYGRERNEAKDPRRYAYPFVNAMHVGIEKRGRADGFIGVPITAGIARSCTTIKQAERLVPLEAVRNAVWFPGP